MVIIGITIAFQINILNESNKSEKKEKNYLKSFYEGNRNNESNLSLTLEFALKTKNNIDTLKKILISKDYQDDRIMNISASIMMLSNFNPSLVTMENITASIDFELISNFEYRENLVNTYNSYQTTSQLEGILSDYVDQYVTPFFFKNVNFRNFTSLKENFIKKPKFENIVLGYDALLTQKLNGYQENIMKLKKLNQLLTTANNAS